MASGNLFGIGVSGLLGAQRALATTGHNVANVDTPGFSRQRAELVTRPPQGTVRGFIGTGVEVSTVRRIFDGFLVEQLRVSTSATSELERFHALAGQVDNALSSPEAGLAGAVEGFFSALQDLAADPSATPARQVVLASAGTLANRFHALDARLADLGRSIDVSLRDAVNEINDFAAGVAELNRAIQLAEGAALGQPANDLRDQREELVRQMAERVAVTTFEQDDGALNVTVGGQALVVGTSATSLEIVANPEDPSRAEIGITVGGTTAVISGSLRGGTLGGALDFRGEVLDPTHNALGRLAIGVARAVNDQHRLGVDLEGRAGEALFNALDVEAPRALPSTNNTGDAVVSARVSDPSALTTSDYRLENQGGVFRLTRLADDTVFTLDTFPAGPQTIDGVTLELASGTFADGDSFLVQPTRTAARDIEVTLADPRKLAAAAPIRTRTALANTGDARISGGEVNSPNNRLLIAFTSPTTFDVTDETTGATLATGVGYVSGADIRFNGLTFDISGAPAAGDTFTVDNTVAAADVGNGGTGVISEAAVAPPDPNLSDTVTLTFDDPPSTFTVAGATTGTPTSGVAFQSGSPISFNGWTVTITGNPAAGDTFVVERNAGGVGDNRNALALARLQTTPTLEGETATIGDAYGQLVTEVGTRTRTAGTNLAASRAVLEQASDARDAVSGVNLEEEAANLLRFQQIFQASARIIAVADATFASLLDAVGR